MVFQTWWSYERDAGQWFSTAYHWFNLFEGAAWLIFALLVLRHWRQSRQSARERWYAAAFVTFGLTDFREAWYQQSWLLWVKGVNLLALFRLRRIILRRYYPEARLF